MEGAVWSMLRPMTIDLRSDTVTKPTEAMRRAMASAEVGDDCYGDDPTANRFEARISELFGKEAALFVPSGTMANQIAIRLHTKPGDEVIIGEGAHCMHYESGAAAALSGVQFMIAGKGGLYTRADMEALVRPVDMFLPRTGLVMIENTHNRAGGRVFPQNDVLAITEYSRSKNLGLHLDGARLWNAHVKSGIALDALAKPFDTVSVCFSKGLGAPVGSVLLGTRAHIDVARRFRKMLGGGMRQIGILCAAAEHGLDNHLKLLADDHARAAKLVALLANCEGYRCDPKSVETNIINLEAQKKHPDEIVAQARKEGVLVNAEGGTRVRVVTNLSVGDKDVEVAAEVLKRAAS